MDGAPDVRPEDPWPQREQKAQRRALHRAAVQAEAALVSRASGFREMVLPAVGAMRQPPAQPLGSRQGGRQRAG